MRARKRFIREGAGRGGGGLWEEPRPGDGVWASCSLALPSPARTSAHVFSSIRPDWRLLKLLASLREKNTDALIGGIQRVLEGEGIR